MHKYTILCVFSKPSPSPRSRVQEARPDAPERAAFDTGGGTARQRHPFDEVAVARRALSRVHILTSPPFRASVCVYISPYLPPAPPSPFALTLALALALAARTPRTPRRPRRRAAVTRRNVPRRRDVPQGGSSSRSSLGSPSAMAPAGPRRPSLRRRAD